MDNMIIETLKHLILTPTQQEALLFCEKNILCYGCVYNNAVDKCKHVSEFGDIMKSLSEFINENDIYIQSTLVKEKLDLLNYCNTQPNCHHCKYKNDINACKNILNIKMLADKLTREEI